MARKSETTKRKPAPSSDLVSQYQAIGPGAIIAALLCMPRRRVYPASRASKSS